MRTTKVGSLRARQWGRAGPIMALVSVLIIAALAKVTLAQFGQPQDKPATASATTGERAPGPDGATVAEEPANAPPPTPSNAIDKARAVQGIVARQAGELAARIEQEGE